MVTSGSETVQNASDGRPEDPIEALRHERRVSAALREVGVALGTTFDLDDLLELILSKLTELVEADRATLYLLDEVKKELVSRLVVGDKVRSIRMKLGHGIPGMVAQTGKAIRIRDAYADPQFERDWDVLTGYRTKSMLAAPLMAGNTVVLKPPETSPLSATMLGEICREVLPAGVRARFITAAAECAIDQPARTIERMPAAPAALDDFGSLS